MDMGKKEEEEGKEGEGEMGGATVRIKWICYATLGRYIFRHSEVNFSQFYRNSECVTVWGAAAVKQAIRHFFKMFYHIKAY